MNSRIMEGSIIIYKNIIKGLHKVFKTVVNYIT